MSTHEEMSIVTEIGVFGDLNIDDPSVTTLKKKKELEKLIAESIKENSNIQN